MDAVRRRGNSLIGYLNQTKGEAQGVIGKETAVTFVTRDGGVSVFCGLDSVHGLICVYAYGVVLFLSLPIMTADWPCLILMFHKIVYVQQKSTQLCVPGQFLDFRAAFLFLKVNYLT